MTPTELSKLIPDAVVKKARTAAEKVYGTQFFNEEIEAAIAAGLAAWPGMQHRIHIEQAIIIEQEIILPLTENPDE